MSQPVQILASDGQVITAQIAPMTQQHYNDAETIWKPILEATGQPDASWMWDYKFRQSRQEDRYEAYALLVENFPQGLMFIETQWHRSCWPQRWPIVYVEAVSTAPWNRIEIERPPWFKQVGRVLLLYARQRSMELGYSGRVGLHSLPGAEGFYRRLRMTDHGPDAEKEGLVYFEYNALQ